MKRVSQEPPPEAPTAATGVSDRRRDRPHSWRRKLQLSLAVIAAVGLAAGGFALAFARPEAPSAVTAGALSSAGASVECDTSAMGCAVADQSTPVGTAPATTVADVVNLTTAPVDDTLPEPASTTAVSEAPPEPQTTFLGGATFQLPPTAAEFRQPDALPSFVVNTHTWSINDEGVLSVTVQSVVPLFPDSDLYSEFDANGLHWRVYETGTRPGNALTAYAADPDGIHAVLVGGQSWASSSDQMLRDSILAVAGNLQYHVDSTDGN